MPTSKGARAKLGGLHLPTETSVLATNNIKDYITMWYGPPGVGKCFGIHTPMLMFDGTIKMVEEVQVDDLLMGPDSQPRRVKSLARGEDTLFRVTPTKGEPYVVNQAHVLSLKDSPRDLVDRKTVNMPITEYLGLLPTPQFQLKGWRTGVEWADHTVPIDPYILGLWLGNGLHTRPQFCINDLDEEVVDKLRKYAASMGLYCTLADIGQGCKTYRIAQKRGEGMGEGKNPLLNSLRELRLIGNKHIPHQYLANSREVRLQLLAGLMDTDGSLTSCGTSFRITQKRKDLAGQIAFLAGSLGFFAHVAEKWVKKPSGKMGCYHRVTLSGPGSEIPTVSDRKQAQPRRKKKDVMLTSINVEEIGRGEYFGFTVEGPDRLFLLGDFTVVHNTTFVNDLASSVLFLSTDRGTRFLNAQRVECLSWEKMLKVVTALEEQENPPYDMVCVDHVGDMLTFAEDFVIKEMKVESLGDGKWGRGWKLYQKTIHDFVRRLLALNIGVSFIAHEKITTVRTRSIELERTMPEMSKAGWKVMVPLCDIVGYCGFRNIRGADEKRKEVHTIETEPREDLYAKDRTTRAKPEKGWALLNGKKFVETFSQIES